MNKQSNEAQALIADLRELMQELGHVDEAYLARLESAFPAVSPTNSDPFTTVPETTLPGGRVVPAFLVGKYVCSQGADGKAAVTAEGVPWSNITFDESKAACEKAGYSLLTESQWLATAWNVSQQDCNWTKGKVGEGKLFRGIRKSNVNSAQPGTFVPTSAKERRFLTLSNGEQICDLNGNIFQWVFDDVQGTERGLTSVIEADSLSLQAPFPPEEKGMGWRPSSRVDWSGSALVRGGCWLAEAYAGAFHLRSGWPDRRRDHVGFRCTNPNGL